jgi:hypothetical protein
MWERGPVRGLAVLGAPVLLALTLVVTAPPAPASGVAQSDRAAQPRWQHLPSLDHSGHGNRLTNLAWSAGRAWLVVGSLRGLTVASPRPSGGALGSAQTTKIAAPLGWYPLVVGSDLLYSTARGASGISRLLPNGKVAPAVAASPEPMAAEKGIPVAAASVRGRLIWALAGGIPIGEGMSFKTTLAACCDASGAAVDLTSLITSRPAPRDHAIGVDAKGRVWLAWLDNFGRNAQVRMVELDSTTLARRTPKALVAPIPRASRFRLACGQACRLVVQAGEPRPAGGFREYVASWAPGERAATRLALPVDKDGAYEHPALLAADYRGSRLAIAYMQGSSDHGATLKILVGDARAAKARVGGSVEMPGRFEGRALWSFSAGAFTPSGFVFAQTYASNFGARVVVVATAVPLR